MRFDLKIMQQKSQPTKNSHSALYICVRARARAICVKLFQYLGVGVCVWGGGVAVAK